MKTWTKLVPPTTASIKAMIAADLSLKKCLAEFIANSLDQSSTAIDLKLDKKKGVFSISDNGKGCPNLELMVEIGTHIPSENEDDSIGVHGVGFKDGAIWLGNEVIVDSMLKSNGKKEYAFADWQNMITIKEWMVDFGDDSARTAPGVTVTISGLRGRRFKAWNEAPNYIGQLFSAAIDAGVKITVDGKTVSAQPQPLLENAVEFESEFNGLAFKGIAGILVDKKAAPSGWEVRYQTQTIRIGYIQEGFGMYSPQGFYGRFYMKKGKRRWQVNRNKTDSEDLTEVMHCQYLQNIIRPILEILKKRNETVAINLNQIHAQTLLTNLLQKVKISITNEEEQPGHGGGLGPNPCQRRRKRKGHNDPLGNTKQRIKIAQEFKIDQHESPEIYGLAYVSCSEGGKIYTAYIDVSTPVGSNIWQSHPLLVHQAIVALSAYFGDRTDILRQLRLPMGALVDTGEQKMSQCLLYLLSHADPEQLKGEAKAA